MRASVATLLMILAFEPVAHAQSRTKLMFFAGEGAAPNEFNTVADLVRLKVILASRELSYLETTTLARKMPAAPARPRFWSDTGSLLLVGGLVVRDQSSATLLNEVFLGIPLRADLPDPLFVSVPFTAKTFKDQKDALSALTLYAVAMDRLSGGDRTPATRELFAKAKTFAAGVKSTDDDINAVRAAIETQLRKFK